MRDPPPQNYSKGIPSLQPFSSRPGHDPLEKIPTLIPVSSQPGHDPLPSRSGHDPPSSRRNNHSNNNISRRRPPASVGYNDDRSSLRSRHGSTRRSTNSVRHGRSSLHEQHHDYCDGYDHPQSPNRIPTPDVIVIRKESHSPESPRSVRDEHHEEMSRTRRGRSSTLRRRNGSDSSRSRSRESYYSNMFSTSSHSFDEITMESLSIESGSCTCSSLTTGSTDRLSRKIAVIIVGALMVALSVLGVQTATVILKSGISMLSETLKEENRIRDRSVQSDKASINVEKWEPTSLRSLQTDGEVNENTATESESKSDVSLRGYSPAAETAASTVSTNHSESLGGMAQHETKKIDKDIREDEINKQTNIEESVEEEEVSPEETEGYQPYMGKDATRDFFYAGKVSQNESSDAYSSDTSSSYATLPFSADANPYVLSLWFYLAPDSSSSNQPRVILSNRWKDARGCTSDRFGGPASGMVLYALPKQEVGHSNFNNAQDIHSPRSHHIVLEYALAENQKCGTLIGSTKSGHIVAEGEWHHVALLVSRTEPDEINVSEGAERISMYLDGNLVGREASVKHRLPSRGPKVDTIVGRHKLQGHSSSSSPQDESAFDLGGRLGMLSVWEIGGPEELSRVSRRMKVQSEHDEDHVVRAVHRAGFDVRALQELAMQGLAVKEPTLLYTFDEQKQNVRPESEESTPNHSPVPEVISGLNGLIIRESAVPITDNSEKKIPHFEPLGGNRFPEYRDGEYVPPHLTQPEQKELDEVARARKEIIKRAMKHVWKGYQKYAWGKDELRPLTNEGYDNFGGMGTTLIDSLSTLWIMGMKNEFWEARDWVRDHLNFRKVDAVSVCETTTRHLGGLLSAYDLSGDVVFLEKADELGRRLLHAFNTPHGVPYGEIELFDGGRSYNIGWHQDSAVLSEIGSLQVEFRYLARATGKTEYATIAMRALDEVLKLNPESGLYPTLIHNTKHKLSYANNVVSVGTMGDSFYEYLLKLWLQGNKMERRYQRYYEKAIGGIFKKMLHTSRPNYLTYVAQMNNGKVNSEMEHSACFLAGNLVLGAYTHPDGVESPTAQRHLRAGKQLAYTCYQMYAQSKSGLSPGTVSFNHGKDDFAKVYDASFFALRPEAVETFFILYHFTKDPVYREWGWEVFRAIEEYCKTDAGYAAIRDVDTLEKENRMESFFLAGTLKYLYLLQDDSKEIDLLNKHVMNTEGHPLRHLNLIKKTIEY